MSSPASHRRRWFFYGLLVILFIFHHDYFFWDWHIVLGGIPAGLFYDMLYSCICAFTWWLMVRYAWPEELEKFADSGEGGQEGL